MAREMRVKKLHKICSVQGCTNRDTYLITKGGDFSGTINICESCLEEALKAIKEQNKKEEPKKEEYKKAETVKPKEKAKEV